MNIDVLVSNIEKFVLLGPYDINTAISLIENTMFLMDIPYSDITGSVCVFDNEQNALWTIQQYSCDCYSGHADTDSQW